MSEGSRSPSPTSKADMENWSKSFEQQERSRRHAERAAKKKQEEAKRSKVEKLGATNPNVIEIQRIHDWKVADAKNKEAVEKARLNRELADEKAAKELHAKNENRVDKFETVETKRREASQEREKIRTKMVVERARNMPLGSALPMALVF